MSDHLIIDLPSQPSDASRVAVQRADRVALVVERDPVSVACGKAMLDLLGSWGVAQVAAVVVNRTPTAAPMKLTELRARLGCEVVGVVPPAADAMLRAQQASAPLTASQPDHAAAVVLTETANRLMAETIVGVRLD
jgi:Flp pilus assembly CpaE family ATPase